MRDLRVIIATPKRIPFGPGYEGFAQRFHLARNEAVASLRSVAPTRVTVYHPIGFPGRPEVIRGTVAVVDDVWALLGSSSFSRRGLTFDGSVDIVLVDKVIKHSVSDLVRNFRRQVMARTLGLIPPAPGETANANWVRLTQQKSAFELMREIVERGGDGLVEPLWPGLPESELLPVDGAIADPEGRGFPAVLGAFAELLASLGQNRV
jgi:phosphatidylserine/phosphatidylglycerophosphate/cardiolipin synthase-like enzyme